MSLLTFGKGSTGCWWWHVAPQKTAREIRIETFTSHRSWRKYTASSAGATLEVREGHIGGQAGRQTDLGHMPLLGSMGGVGIG